MTKVAQLSLQFNTIAQFRPIAERLVGIAKAYPGKFVVARYGEDPKTGARLDTVNIHVPHSEGVEGLCKAVRLLAGTPGGNVYIMAALVRDDLPDGLKGTEADTVGVLAFVADFDAGHDPASREDRLPDTAHAEVETSPGNFQSWLFFDRPYPPEDVKPILRALVTKVGCDPTCKDVSHVYRVPGTLNWANKAKQKKHGRSPEPVRARLVMEPEDWHQGITLDDLKSAMVVKWGPDVFTAAIAVATEEFDWHQTNGNINSKLHPGTVEKHLHIWTESTDRSAEAFRFMNLAKRNGHTPEEVVQMFLCYPKAPIVGHYVGAGGEISEKRIRDDVVRAFTKEDKRPKRDRSNVFRLHTEEEAKPVREVRVVGGNLPKIIDEAEAGLIEQGTDLFQRGNMIVRPSPHEEITLAKGRTTHGMKLIPVRTAGMMEHLTAAVDFQRYEKATDSWRSIDCPKDTAQAYLERIGMWKLRRLAGTINAPTLRPDGSILERPGYDAATGIFYHPAGVVFPAIPAEPSRAEALAALAMFKRLLSEFPFTSPASRSVALSGFLTACVRRSLPTAPGHASTAPVAGSGKSMLSDLISMVATGHDAPVIAQGRTEEEMEKRLGAALIAGDAIISIDNCTEPLEGALLCQALTQQILMIRRLGQSVNVETPSNAAIFATGNNLKIVGDLTRRFLVCALDPQMERPELRTFNTDPHKILCEHRARYVVAALTVMRAWIVAGRPDFPNRQPALGSFEEWSHLVRDCLMWLGEADPCETIEAARADDPERTQLAALLENWEAVIGERRVTAKEVIQATMGVQTEAMIALGDALVAVAASFVRAGDSIDPVRLGKYLGKHAGRVIDGRAIVKRGLSAGNSYWQLEYQW